MTIWVAPNAAVRGRLPEIADFSGPMDCVTAMEKDRMWHGCFVVNR